MSQPYEINLVNLVERFGSDDKCRKYLEQLRWPNGVSCPRCSHTRISRINDRAQLHAIMARAKELEQNQ